MSDSHGQRGDASAFYRSLGFSEFGNGDLQPMFLPAETVVELRENAAALAG